MERKRGKRFRVGLLIGLIMAGLLAGCGESSLPNLPPPSPTSGLQATVGNTPAARTTAAPATTEAAFLLPTSTPPVIPPTAFPSPTPRPEQGDLRIGASLSAFRTTKASFKTAYGKASARMSGVNGAARLVLAQSTFFDRERTVWTFFFTVPQGNRTWSVTYDSAFGKEKKEQISLRDSAAALLPEEAGQWQVSRVLDSDEVSTRLEQGGLPPDLPLDTVYLQQVIATGQGRVPAYIFVNGALSKQIIVNALTGAIIQNDFI